MMTTPLRGAVAVAYALLLLLLLLPSASASSSSFLGRYRRSASLDRATGIASSKESSAVPIASRLFQRALVGAWRGAGSEDPSTTNNADDDDDGGAEDDSSSAALLTWVERWAQQYPTWLCSGSVTGGLLRAVILVEEAPGGNNKKAKKPQHQQRTQRSYHRRTGKEAVEIRTRIGNVHLLTFGPCHMSQRITYRESLSSENSGGGKEGSVRSRKTSDGRPVLTSHCTVVLPVTGGILVALPPRRGNRKNKERGALLFSLKKQQQQQRVVDASTAQDARNDDDAAFDATTVAATREKKRDPAGLRLQLSTALTGYRPALAGVSLPIPHWRKALYLNTQAALHGYIMWRFHRFGWAGASLIGGGKGE
jgi:hypothetical protein